MARQPPRKGKPRRGTTSRSRTSTKAGGKAQGKRAHHRQRARPTLTRKLRRWLLRIAGYLLLAGLLLSAAWVFMLDREVRSRFEGQRWALPARLYARPLMIYPGAALGQADVIAALKRLGYRRADRADQPGRYRVTASRIELVRRPFDFWDETAPARRVRVVFAPGRVKQVIPLPYTGTTDQPTGSGAPNTATKASVDPVLRLDAEQVASFLPANDEDRVLVRLDDVPKLLVDALIVMEDRGFYQHHGVSPRAIIRALIADLRAGAAVQGGSTLTQQLVKNLYLSSERSLARKLREAVMALLLESHYSKQQIIEAYLNEVFLGQQGRHAVHGFGQGSWLLFGRPVQELTTGQLALLAGLVKAPSAYDPRRHPRRARQRRDLVLRTLAEQGVLSDKQLKAALREPLGVAKPRQGSSKRATYAGFRELVSRQLRRDYPEGILRQAGLRLFSTVDPVIQYRVQRAIERRLGLLEHRSGTDQLQAAVIVANPTTGEVLALAGARHESPGGFNRALDAVRAIGSLVKPAVYAAALARPERYNLATELDDQPLTLSRPGQAPWSPRNFDGAYRGQVTLLQGLVHSINVPTVNLGMEMGLPAVRQLLRALGVERNISNHPSLLLGALELSPLEVSQLYLTFAAQGFRTPLRSITAVTNHQGEPVNRYPLTVHQAMEPATAYLIGSALQEVVRSGTARHLPEMLSSTPTLRPAGKTGTTNDTRDSWFAGYTANFLVVVWIGRDDNRPTGLHGANGAMPLWADVMAQLPARPLHLIAPPQITWIEPLHGASLPAPEQCPGGQGLPVVASHLPAGGRPCGAPKPPVASPAERKKPLHWLRRLFGGG